MTVKQIGIAALDAVELVAWAVGYLADQARMQIQLSIEEAK